MPALMNVSLPFQAPPPRPPLNRPLLPNPFLSRLLSLFPNRHLKLRPRLPPLWKNPRQSPPPGQPPNPLPNPLPRPLKPLPPSRNPPLNRQRNLLLQNPLPRKLRPADLNLHQLILHLLNLRLLTRNLLRHLLKRHLRKPPLPKRPLLKRQLPARSTFPPIFRPRSTSTIVQWPT